MFSTCNLSPKRVFPKTKPWALMTLLAEEARSDLRKGHGGLRVMGSLGYSLGCVSLRDWSKKVLSVLRDHNQNVNIAN